MSSMQGLPARGSIVTILISRVHLHPQCVLVEFWGKLASDRLEEFECLTNEIQFVEKSQKEFEGCPGDQCLVQVDGTWNRARIVSRNGSGYRVFLYDKGVTTSTTMGYLTWGKKEYFSLPPEVEFCVLANVLPLSSESRWSPVALEFLKTLSGKTVTAHVQDVLVPQRTFVLHVPIISQQMYEMGFAKKLSPDTFREFVLMSLVSAGEADMQPCDQMISMEAGVRPDKRKLFMFPELPAGTVETVIITEVTNPHRVFCQLRVFSQELKNLSDKMTESHECQNITSGVGPKMIGFPCAARASDGKWYRSVLQQVFPNTDVVEVLNIDFGTKQLVRLENVKPLASEFLRFPVVTYTCSLHGIVDRGADWRTSQIDFLRDLLLYKTVIAKFEHQSPSDGVHCVTLYGDDGKNINRLFGSKESCLRECEKTHDYGQEDQIRKINRLTFGKTSEDQEHKSGNMELKKGSTPSPERLPAEDLLINSTHVAVVPHISNPSAFWIQTQNYADELLELTNCMYNLYKESENKDVVSNPTVGLFCAAKAEDGEFYRATVAEVGGAQIKVFFVDFGNTEYVERNNVRTLPENLKRLPRLALKCSLAGVNPVDGKWSQSACEFFTRAVTNKALDVHVITKCDDGYVVLLIDPEAEQEKDLGTLLCTLNLAEKTETLRKNKVNAFTQDAFLSFSRYSQVRPSEQHGNKSTYSQSHSGNQAPIISERRIPTFKEHMFSIGSILDVFVSYVESPNDFWCHLIQSSGQLKMLMHDMQAHYDDSAFEAVLDAACVACHPKNRMWYRVLVIRKHRTPHVDVLFVDYGQTETVSVYDLRRIRPEFLNLPGQAFRCSLLNFTDPTSVVNEWTEEAVARFRDFVDTAASQVYILKCTIYAVMFSEQKIVFNVVDLETPFESICTSMVNLVKSSPSPPFISAPPFHLDTYYYSTHNVKTGTEEKMTVTCVNTVGHFYCQLARNADVIEDLRLKVSKLCHQLENFRVPSVFGTLCFAKYTDGYWYRGEIKATKPALRVHFVDYGDTLKVDKCDVLPVPKEANDIMAVPVQALVCGLSDVPTDVPKEVNSWFETFATESRFQALVVAREPDGKLLVELYHKNTQINSKIRTMFQIEMKKPHGVIYRGGKAPESSAKREQNHLKGSSKLLPDFFHSAPHVKKTCAYEQNPVNVSQKSLPKPSRPTGDRPKKALPVQLYTPPPRRKPCEKMLGNGSEPARLEAEPPEEQELVKSSPPDGDCKNTVELPKLTDLPSKVITSGTESEVYVSHYNSPSSFYVQLVQEEDEIFSVSEKLNDPTSFRETVGVTEVRPGDLVQAEFAEDSSLYRAVVKEIHTNSTALVEFIDFGNTAVTPISKMSRLDQSLLIVPRYSTHCTLSDVAAHRGEETSTLETVSDFTEAACGDENKRFKCRFIRQSVGSVWEVGLEDDGNVLKCLPAGPEMTLEEQENETPEQDPNKSPHNSYRHQEIPEKQQLKSYITTLNDDLSFWCQRADSEELDEITSRISRVANTADRQPIDTGLLSTGDPCLVLFSDDEQWYRAQVTNRNGSELSVFFVDYGNATQVGATEAREIPADLVAPPPQAFLCELEGFDTSRGCWASGAFEELTELTTDKLLELTIAEARRDKDGVKYCVEVECEGQGISEKMKTWWKSSTAESNPDASNSLLQVNSTSSEMAMPERASDICQSREREDDERACSDPQGEHVDERDAGADEVSLPCRPETCKTPEVLLKSTAELSQNGGRALPDRNTAGEPKGSAIPEDVEVEHGVFQTILGGTLLPESGIKAAALPQPADQDFVSLGRDEDCEEESAVGRSATEFRSGCDGNQVANSSDGSLTSATAVRMVPCQDFNLMKSVDLGKSTVLISDDLKQFQNNSFEATAYAVDTADDNKKSMIVKETSELHTDSGPLPCDSEPETCLPALSPLVEDLTHTAGMSSLTDAFADRCREAEPEESEDEEDASPKKGKESSPSGEEPSTDDGFEVQLAKKTHLSLTITDGSGDAAQKSEEE